MSPPGRTNRSGLLISAHATSGTTCRPCEQRIGSVVAATVLMPLFRPGGEAQYVDTPTAAAVQDALSDALAWGTRNLAAGISVDDLARHAAVSPRTLTRHFRSATGFAPGEWPQRERLRLTQRLLETTDDPVERVARRADDETSAALRAQFSQRLQTSPRAYRSTFRLAQVQPKG